MFFGRPFRLSTHELATCRLFVTPLRFQGYELLRLSQRVPHAEAVHYMRKGLGWDVLEVHIFS